jgi:hypothetical protein
MENNSKKSFDLSSVVANIDKVKQMKASKPKKANTSIRPLVFDHNPDDSPLKDEIIRRINERKMTYSDIYEYCTKLKGGDTAEGQKLGYNVISGLRKRHTMIDTTFSMLCDFLNLDIMLVERKPQEEDTSEGEDE